MIFIKEFLTTGFEVCVCAIKQLLLCSSILLLITACGKLPINESHVRPNKDVVEQLIPNEALKNAIAVGQVEVSAQVSELAFDVSADLYKRVLIRAIKSQGYRALDENKARYILTAKLQEISIAGLFDVEAHTQIAYRLVDKHDGIPVWFETIVLPYVERYQFGADGTQKIQAAIEGALTENVTHMVRLLADASIPQ